MTLFFENNIKNITSNDVMQFNKILKLHPPQTKLAPFQRITDYTY